MRTIAQIESISWKRGIYKQRVARVECAVPSVSMPKNVKFRLYPLHGGEKLRASSVIIRAGSVVENSIRRSVGDEDIGICGNPRIDLCTILI